ncbi:MAG: chemotaxis protein MotB [Proteobacteria bacterium]|nr:MAG: chemotaxis protein MotB [Pseudomonadota bacterium]
MADKKPMVVIKKITVVAGGGHGGAWKVAFADFMTAMMAFFLVMWLISSASEAEKKAISDYFSTPSVIEYQFQNYGAEMTLEKLFLDLVNEPLKTLSTMTEPADRTPNVLHLGTKKIVMSYMADQLGTMASDVSVTADSVVFEIPDNLLFRQGSSDPALQFVNVMDRVKGVTQGLEDSQVIITSVVYRESVKSEELVVAKNISDQRIDLLVDKVKGALENDSVQVVGKGLARDDDRSAKHMHTGGGFVKFEIRQNVTQADGKKARAIVGGSKEGGDDTAEYESYVNQITAQKKARDPQSESGRAPAKKKRRALRD